MFEGSLAHERGTLPDCPPDRRALLVSAAHGLKEAFSEIGEAFDGQNNSKTTFNFAASGVLQQQIEAGAPADVFASAAPVQMNALLEKDLMDPATVEVFASNEIVLAAPASSTLGIQSFEDLTRDSVTKVATGDPATTAHGSAAMEILAHLNLLAQVEDKLVFTANVSQTRDCASRGEVDAAVLFATDTMAEGVQLKVVAIPAPDWHSPISYVLAIARDSKNPALSRAFVDFVTGSEGQSVLRKHGFLPAAE